MKNTILFISLILPFFVLSQGIINIQGVILNTIKENDTIYFSNGRLNKNYYQTDLIKSVVNNGKVNFNIKVNYPQLFFLNLYSEKNKIPQRSGYYFIDETTKKINIDISGQNVEVFGKIGREFKYEFTPYILGEKPTMTLQMYVWDKATEFENKLLNYTKKNPNSYVALWLLIESLQNNGITNLFEETLNTFSKKMKSEKPWQELNKEFQNIRIRPNKKFPEILLQNTDLKQELLTIPESQYTLIDFWFSRCRPCLEQMPQLINIYNRYKEKHFNVIGISSDKTVNVVPYWQKRIIEKGIPWKNYLDENAVFCTTEKIISFPTNFLLNQKGEVIKKNISLEDLEKFLGENLK